MHDVTKVAAWLKEASLPQLRVAGELAGWRVSRQSLLLLDILEVDSQLLALLVEMAAFQAQRFGGLRNVPVVAL